MVKALLGRLVALAIILTAVGLGWSYYRATQRNPTSDDASIDADVVHMAASVGGRIVELPVQENQLVRKDEVVFRIDPEPYRLRLEAALAEVKAGEGLLASQTRAVATERANVEIADQQVVRARSNLELATNTLARIKPLHPKGYVSDQQVDDAATAKRNAETSLTQAMQQAAAARGAVGDTESAKANLETRKATAALAARDLANTVVKAPHEGRVTGLTVKSGEFVAPGQSLFTLIVTDEWFAVANFRETELDRIRSGGCAVVYSMIDRTVPIKGRVDSIGYGVSGQDRVNLPRSVPIVVRSVDWVHVAQRFPVRVKLENPPEDLARLGASAIVRIPRDGDC